MLRDSEGSPVGVRTRLGAGCRGRAQVCIEKEGPELELEGETGFRAIETGLGRKSRRAQRRKMPDVFREVGERK